MPTYLHKCYDCDFEWTEVYSMKENPPEKCPSCEKVGFVKRLISGIPAVKMIMSGAELKDHIKQEQKKIAQQLKTDENLKANLAGEEKYNNFVSESQRLDKKYGKEIEKIEKKINE
jgi:putative FmdB family regulatory protein